MRADQCLDRRMATETCRRLSGNHRARLQRPRKRRSLIEDILATQEATPSAFEILAIDAAGTDGTRRQLRVSAPVVFRRIGHRRPHGHYGHGAALVSAFPHRLAGDRPSDSTRGIRRNRVHPLRAAPPDTTDL